MAGNRLHDRRVDGDGAWLRAHPSRQRLRRLDEESGGELFRVEQQSPADGAVIRLHTARHQEGACIHQRQRLKVTQ